MIISRATLMRNFHLSFNFMPLNFVEIFLSKWSKHTNNKLSAAKYKINRNSSCNIDLKC